MNVVINYCTLDEQFIEHTINSVLPIANEIIIPVSDHWYDGTPEDLNSVKNLADRYRGTGVRIILFKWEEGRKPRYWHNYARYVGFTNLKDKSGWILWLDSDEVVDTERFKKWWNTNIHTHYGTIKLANYWYFRDTTNQANNYEDSVVLCRGQYLDQRHFFHNYPIEREMFYNGLAVHRLRNVLGEDGKPLIHHYSWVRTKEQMLHKVKSWGHNTDRDWISLVEEEFTHPFNGTDFIHGYTYTITKPYIDLRLED